MTVSDLEETVQGKRIPYLIWRSLAAFTDLQTVTLAHVFAHVFLDLWRRLPVAGNLN